VAALDLVAPGVRELALEPLGGLGDPVLLERLAGERDGLDGDVQVAQQAEVEPVGAHGEHAPAGLVVAEDDRALHRRQPADGVAHLAVEDGGVRLALDPREQVGEQLERFDVRPLLHAVHHRAGASARRSACSGARNSRHAWSHAQQRQAALASNASSASSA
jgi:hypothetical protein